MAVDIHQNYRMHKQTHVQNLRSCVSMQLSLLHEFCMSKCNRDDSSFTTAGESAARTESPPGPRVGKGQIVASPSPCTRP